MTKHKISDLGPVIVLREDRGLIHEGVWHRMCKSTVDESSSECTQAGCGHLSSLSQNMGFLRDLN